MRHSFIAVAIIGLCLFFSSCIYDEEEIGVKGGSIYLRISLSDGASATRTTGPTEEDLATEKKVSDMSVFLVSQTSSTNIIQVGGVKVQDNQSDLIEIPAEKQGKYNLYVVTNTGNNTAFTPKTTSGSTLVGAYGSISSANAPKFWTANEFLMTNKQNEVGGTAAVEVNLTGSHPMEDPIKVEVELERMAVKVEVKEGTSMTASPVGKTTIYGSSGNSQLSAMWVEGSCLMNCANQFNLIQQWANATKASDYSSATPKGYPELLLVSPSSATTYSIADGYYNRWSDLVTSNQLSTGITFVEAGNPMYCFENNSPYYASLPASETNESPLKSFAKAKTKMKGRTTAVAIKVGSKIGGEAKTFYQYNGICYGDLTKLLAKNPGLTSTISTASTAAQLRTADVKVFENGYMYYIHWIKDVNYKDDGANYYTVMRNTYYGLTVDAITGLGDDIPGGEDYNPYDPIDVGSSPLKVTPVVRDWSIFDIDLTL